MEDSIESFYSCKNSSSALKSNNSDLSNSNLSFFSSGMSSLGSNVMSKYSYGLAGIIARNDDNEEIETKVIHKADGGWVINSDYSNHMNFETVKDYLQENMLFPVLLIYKKKNRFLKNTFDSKQTDIFNKILI